MSLNFRFRFPPEGLASLAAMSDAAARRLDAVGRHLAMATPKSPDQDGLLEYSVVYSDRSLNHMSAKFQVGVGVGVALV